VVCAWLANDEAATRKHYLRVTDAHFDRAAGKSSQNASHQPRQVEANAARSGAPDQQKTPENPHDCEFAGVPRYPQREGKNHGVSDEDHDTTDKAAQKAAQLDELQQAVAWMVLNWLKEQSEKIFPPARLSAS
jgi:hypothetical protein